MAEQSSRILYKFRSFSDPYHRCVITDQEVWFAPPGKFNDPFDFNIPVRADKASEKTKRIYLEEIRRAKPDMSKAEVAELKRQASASYEVTPEERHEVWRYAREEVFGPRAGVLSLTPHWRKSRAGLMWSHYADSHKGFAVGFDNEVLIAWMKDVSGAPPDAVTHAELEGIQIRGDKVEYVEEMPLLVPGEMSEREMIWRLSFTKGEQWDYEDEHRIMMRKFDADHKPLELTNEDRKQKLPEDAIAEVIIGCRASSECVEWTKRQLAESGSKTRLYKASLKEDAFELEREELHF